MDGEKQLKKQIYKIHRLRATTKVEHVGWTVIYGGQESGI